MIGKYARGFRHLKRSVGSTKIKKLFLLQNGRILQSEAFLSDVKGMCDKQLVLFQNLGGKNDTSIFSSNNRDLANDLLCRYAHYYVVTNTNQLFQFGRRCLMVDDNFDEEFESFKKKNKKLLEQVYGKYCYPQDPISAFMFALTGDVPNIYVWALKNYFNHVSLAIIENTINWSQKYNKLIGKLSKGTITAYNGRDSINKLMDEMVSLRRNKRANDSINLFNTTQKKLLKNIELNNKNIFILNRFGRLSNMKKNNFVRKMSTIENVDEIMQQMSFLSNVHFEWNKNSLLEYIKNTENIKCDIVIDKDNLLLVKVYTYDTIKSLAKTTNWCISKNKRYWNDYVEYRPKAIQYVLFDFDKPEDHELSIIGFTSTKDVGITNAHSFSNNNLMGGNNCTYRQLTSFLESDGKNIYSIIKGHNIPLGKLLNFENKHYNWDITSFMSFLNYCMDEDEYVIHFYDDERIVLSTRHENVRFLVGDSFKNIPYKNNTEVFLFLDFSFDEDDANRLRYGFINQNEYSHEESCEYVFDAYGNNCEHSFDNLLEIFDLPYDTICRTNDEVRRFSHAFRTYDLKTIKSFINNDELISKINNDKNQSFKQYAYNVIFESIFQFNSFDYINLIYDNNKKLIDFITEKSLGDFVISLVYDITNGFRHIGKLPTSDTFEEAVKNVRQQRDRITIAKYYILKRVFEKENNKVIYNKLIEIFPQCVHSKEIDTYLLSLILTTLNFKTLNNTSSFYLKHIANLHSQYINDILLEKDMSTECGVYFLRYLSTQSPNYEFFKEKFGAELEKKDKEKINPVTFKVKTNSSDHTFSYFEILNNTYTV